MRRRRFLRSTKKEIEVLSNRSIWSWIVPKGCYKVDVFLVGGGNGGNGAGYHYAGSGGNGGRVMQYLDIPVTPGATVSYNIGTGGNGGSGRNFSIGDNGASGGVTWFIDSTKYSSSYGEYRQGGRRTEKGAASAKGSPGIGGFKCSYYDQELYGASGASGGGVDSLNDFTGGVGGVTGGGNGGNAVTNQNGTAGTSGTFYGAGGGGAGKAYGLTGIGRNGGNGYQGIIILRY